MERAIHTNRTLNAAATLPFRPDDGNIAIMPLMRPINWNRRRNRPGTTPRRGRRRCCTLAIFFAPLAFFFLLVVRNYRAIIRAVL
jgi:hypothetical protein